MLSELLQSSLPKFSEVIPSSGKKISFRPFLVKEEKMLLMAQETGGEHGILFGIRDVVQACYEGIPDASKIPFFDLEYLFIKLRSKSVGEVAYPILICPVTGEQVKLDINLNDIKIKKTKNHSNKIKISDNILIGMKYPSVSLLIEHDINSENTKDFYEMAISCIDYIETNEEKIEAQKYNREEIKSFVDNMTKQQFDKIIEFFVTMPKIEEEVNYTTSDGITRSITLKGIKDFFE
jgi:hypothetical protein